MGQRTRDASATRRLGGKAAWIAAGSMAAAVAGSFGAGTSTSACASDAPPSSAPKPILIGVSLGLTGGLASVSAPLRDAVRVAEGEINAAGGLLGRPVVFDVQDDKSDEEKGFVESVANGFVSRGAVAVIGPVGSGQVVKVQDIYAKAHVIQITPSATSTELTNIQPATDRWLYRTTPADDFQGAAVMLLAQRTPNGLALDGGVGASDAGSGGLTTCRKLAIIYADNSYGSSMTDVITSTYSRRGGTIAYKSSIPVDAQTKYDDQVNAFFGAAPECLAVIHYDQAAAALVKQIKADSRFASLPKGFFFIGTDGVFTDAFLTSSSLDKSDLTSTNTADGVTGTNPDTQPPTPEFNDFATLYASYFPLKGGATIQPFAANAFDAAVLVALAIQKAGGTDDRPAIRDALVEIAGPPGTPYRPGDIGPALQAIQQGDDIDYSGASGAVDIEANGNVKGGFIVWDVVRDPTSKKYGFTTIGRLTLADLVAELK